MSADGGDFRGAGGRRIVWRSWTPDATPAGVVTIAHGFGEHLGRYEDLATRLTAKGLQVYGLDHHGHGRSEGRRGQIDLSAAVADLDQLIDSLASRRHPDLPQFLLGHSLGGAIALRYAIAHQHRLSGLVVSAPLAAVAEGRAMQEIGKLLGVIVPPLPVTRIDPGLVSRDVTVVDDYRADPLNYHGSISAGVARGFIRHVQSLPSALADVRLPTLLMWGSADRLCPVSGAEMVARRIGSRELTVKQYPGLYHEIFNEPERDTVIADTLDWLRAHLHTRPAADAGAASVDPGSA